MKAIIAEVCARMIVVYPSLGMILGSDSVPNTQFIRRSSGDVLRLVPRDVPYEKELTSLREARTGAFPEEVDFDD